MKNKFLLFITRIFVVCICTQAVHSQELKINKGDNKQNSIDLPTDLPTTASDLTVYPGEILSISYQRVDEQIPEFYFGRKRLAAIAVGDHWRVFTGISANMIPGRYVITVTQPDKSNEKIDFTIKPSRNALATSRSIDRPSNFILNRLQSRKKKKTPQFKIPELPWANLTPTFPIKHPAKGQWSQNFGEIQIDNDGLKRLNHIQLVTTEPQPVLSPADAICLEISEKEGIYSIWLDHGMGLFSHISGLKNVTIEEQDKIVSGSMISNIIDQKNTSPQTIKWRILFNGALVNPHSAAAL